MLLVILYDNTLISRVQGIKLCELIYEDVIKCRPFPRYWPFMRKIHRLPHKGQWRRALVFSLICVWTNDWVNNRGGLLWSHYHGVLADGNAYHWFLRSENVLYNRWRFIVHMEFGSYIRNGTVAKLSGCIISKVFISWADGIEHVLRGFLFLGWPMFYGKLWWNF